MGGELLTLDELSRLDSDALREIDVAALNLIAARGLPGIADSDSDQILDWLDDWARRVRLEIWRHLYRFESTSSQESTEFSYGNSLGRFFCWFLLQVLQEDCGVAYHPDRKFNPDFCRPQDLFIHGIVGEDGQGGTCASMPVVYVAVGRRLGLPVYLVEARGHLLFRWDDPQGTTIRWDSPPLELWIPPDRFNVEGSGEGIAYYDDSHYIQWPELWTEQDFEHGRYLRSMSPKEDLAAFLVQRAECFSELGDWNECLKSIAMARRLVPEDLRYEWLHAKRTVEWQEYEDRLARLHEQNLKQRNARQSLPGVPGHSPACCCVECRSRREKLAQLPTAPHGESCQCLACREARHAWRQVTLAAPHGESCQCVACRNARNALEAFEPLPGHPPLCSCFQCAERRRAVPGQQAFGAATPFTPHLPAMEPQLGVSELPHHPQL